MTPILLQGTSFAIVEQAPTLIINIIIALVIILLGFMAGKIISSVLNKALTEMQIDKGLSKFKKQKMSVVKGISSLVALLIYILSVIIALNHLGIFFYVLMAFLVIFAIIVFGSFIISFLSSFPKAYYGAQILLTNKVPHGSRIETQSISGKVMRTSLLNTRIMTPDNEIISVPNNIFFGFLKKK